MAKQPKTPPHEAAHDDSAKPPSADRRRWLKAGLSTPPVLMTVASRPVLASTCVPPSAYVSLGASAPGMKMDCLGDGPQTWSSGDDWPSGYYPGKAAEKDEDKERKETRQASGSFNSAVDQATRFNACFEPDLNGNPTLSDVLGYGNIANVSDTVHTVARYVTAALLNNASNKVPETVLRAMTIQHIWTEFARTGSFAPTRGASWSATEIVEYLRSTMTSA
jgi:hypothetical protein